jgi:hypothetical protein
MGLYKKLPFSRGTGQGVYLPDPLRPKVVGVKHNLPGSIIVVHGVNDVGTSYEAVEAGLCEGLTARLRGGLRAATYRMPAASDRGRLEEDPDAVFFKRQVNAETHSPVIPFYWGYREESDQAVHWSKTPHGQALDRYGNRLDKDFSKGGGPFANATNSLPEMWNRGKSAAHGLLDWAQRDPTHPVLENPGRLYMILAARRLAALITMIRDYDADETVSIVAHSQGCMLSLLAQAFLLDPKMKAEQPDARPADTLVLCNPPYSLVDEMPLAARTVDGYSGRDAAMKGRYQAINGEQTLHARLSTLANIVKGVQQQRHGTPALAELPDAAKHCGVVGANWRADGDRDNRGKVYLYFSPEDMTVALSNVQGIGWQGVPEFQRGHDIETSEISASNPMGDVGGGVTTIDAPVGIVRKALAELGTGFFQRVFTLKRRPDFQNGKFVLVGQAAPYDFALRVAGEDDQSHTEVSDSFASKHAIRARLPGPGGAPAEASREEQERFNLRKITGEALPKAVVASMGEGALPDAHNRYAASENVDQIDAAIAVTSDYGIKGCWQCIGDPGGDCPAPGGAMPEPSPRPDLHSGKVVKADDHRFALAEKHNRSKGNEDKYEIKNVFVCLDDSYRPQPLRPAKLLVHRTETANEARLRWQHAQTARSFHGAVFGGRKNHSRVTAYDVAIGRGTAPTDPLFYAYLCAVADWRLKKPNLSEFIRPGILEWARFMKSFIAYWEDERPWRKALIEGNSNYYTTGVLPTCLPLPPDGLPSSVVMSAL